MPRTDPSHSVGARVPTAAKLGSSVRRFAGAATAVGTLHGWKPAPESDAAAVWRRAQDDDPVSRTLAEADLHAIMLMRSGFEHMMATGAAIGASRAFAPHTLARTTSEHFLRSQHAIDPTADVAERARRRLNEWLYAIHEGNLRNQGLLSAGHVGPGDVGRSRADMVAQVATRADAFGESVEPVNQRDRARRSPRVAGTAGRESTMSLAERYTAGDAVGIPNFTMRGHAAVAHGTEIGLLNCVADEGTRASDLGEVLVPVPEQQEAPTLAFMLMGVVLTSINAFEAMQEHFGWPTNDTLDRRLSRARKVMVDTWSAAVQAAD